MNKILHTTEHFRNCILYLILSLLSRHYHFSVSCVRCCRTYLVGTRNSRLGCRRTCNPSWTRYFGNVPTPTSKCLVCLLETREDAGGGNDCVV